MKAVHVTTEHLGDNRLSCRHVTALYVLAAWPQKQQVGGRPAIKMICTRLHVLQHVQASREERFRVVVALHGSRLTMRELIAAQQCR